MDHPSIVVPDQITELELLPVVSVSGGKDSTAVCLALEEAGVEHIRVFADTEWEAKETYEHLDLLRELLGPIDVVGREGGMVGGIRRRCGFPSRVQRWCTKELKLRPLRKYHRQLGQETVSALGIRSDESQRRAQMAVFEDDDTWDGWVWRPIMQWTVEDVLSIHKRHAVPMSPLYHKGFDRVGCWPCIFAKKGDVRLLADLDPSRVDLIRDLENWCIPERHRRNAEQPGRYRYPDQATFFQSIDRKNTNTIDQVVEWSRTAHGGKQMDMFPSDPTGGCFRWGLCEPP